ncbi:MAG TPA: hypothetical protein VGF98_02805 [Candidatus Tumulicola sp.]|jgi:hypothetical protein
MRNNARNTPRIAGGLIAACLFAFFSCSPACAASKTLVTFFSPWTSAGTLRLDFHVVETVTGNCWTDSLSTSRGDAYRCMAHDSIYDPCFAPTGHPHAVACSNDPFAKRVVLFKLTKPLPSAPTPMTQFLQPHNQPWGLRLTNGEKCFFETGATDAVHDERLNYQCKDPRWIIGQPDNSTPFWTAQSVNWPNKRITHVSIAQVVF